MTKQLFTNELINSSSPYLLQHAHNPVNWLPWSASSLAKAKQDDKPIIVSIGYSACHWCHVMERESFEDSDIAAIMNEYFICIKVDREERPDVDQVYMDALHAMGLQGGWPLNVFLLPDQRPFYGGTYFPPQGWTQLCTQIGQVFKEKRAELEKSAEGFMASLSISDIKKYGLESSKSPFTKDQLSKMFLKHEENFDLIKGGNKRAPKFPMPVTYRFLLFEGQTNQNTLASDHALRTANHMAWGGLYDQIGGGFTRYSTDMDWFVPHFEKMLYDNGQLLTLYSECFQVSKDPYYREVVEQTVDWIKREMHHASGGFYSALDADSEGEEGKFYLWSADEFKNILGPDAELMMEFYHITSGNWEPQKNIPYREGSLDELAQKRGMALDELRDIIKSSQLKLLDKRNRRTRPGLDDKILTGWNGLTLKGLCDAYAIFGNKDFLELALTNAHFLNQTMTTEQGELFRNFKNGQVSIAAYLEDYAAVISGYIALYQVSFDELWLERASELTVQAIDNFFDHDEEFFFFTSNHSEELIARKKEIWDNVIPSSNSMMAENLLDLSILLDRKEWRTMAETMVNKMDKILHVGPQDTANWARVYGRLTYPTAEIALVGKDPFNLLHQINQDYLPNKIIVGKKTGSKSDLPLLIGRDSIKNKDTLFLCYDKACQLPVHTSSELIAQINLSQSN
jgi:uncharacterized protein YyaL (SSP411 family)